MNVISLRAGGLQVRHSVQGTALTVGKLSSTMLVYKPFPVCTVCLLDRYSPCPSALLLKHLNPAGTLLL